MSTCLLLLSFSLLISTLHGQLACDGVEYSLNGKDSLVLPAGACITSIVSDSYMASTMYTCNNDSDLIYNYYANSNCSGTPQSMDSAVRVLGLRNSGNNYYKIVCGQKQCDYAIARKYRIDKGCSNTINKTDLNALYEDTIYTLLSDGACFRESTWSYGYIICTEGVSIERSYFGQNTLCLGNEIKEEMLENECGSTDDMQYGTILHIKCVIFPTTATPTTAPVVGVENQENDGTNVVIIAVVSVLFVLLLIICYCYYRKRQRNIPYELGQTIGDGRTCRVVEGKKKGMDQEIGEKKLAIKIMSKNKANAQILWKREVDILSRIKHKNIIEYIENAEDDKNYYIITGLYEGGDLVDRIVNPRYNITESTAALIINNILLSVQYLHKNNIVHRDIKPEHFVFNTTDLRDANTILIDFGSAWIVNDDKKYNKELKKKLVGSVHYMAPELIEKKSNIEKTGKLLKCSDIWSVGVTAYVMLCGQKPFKKKTDKDVFDCIINDELMFPSNPLLSDSFKHFVGKMLVKNPYQRITCDEALCDPFIQGNV